MHISCWAAAGVCGCPALHPMSVSYHFSTWVPTSECGSSGLCPHSLFLQQMMKSVTKVFFLGPLKTHWVNGRSWTNFSFQGVMNSGGQRIMFVCGYSPYQGKLIFLTGDIFLKQSTERTHPALWLLPPLPMWLCWVSHSALFIQNPQLLCCPSNNNVLCHTW